ncbi:MAG: dihydrolipoyl dehydrogenase [Vampirovibrionales bacterium]|nr:dihydrolipoyl dehydrogenase [Vampirovibrionales bacterium]
MMHSSENTPYTDVAIIGAGPGGYVAAIRLAQNGQRVTLIEQEALGGTCLNWGCIPSKAFIYAGHLADTLEKAAPMGLIASHIRLDMARLQHWKQTIVQRLTGGIRQLLIKHGVQMREGSAAFVDPTTLAIGDELLRAQKIIIATGSVASPLSMLPVDGHRIVDARHVLDWHNLPNRLIVVGGGVIGVEMASMMHHLGVPEVSIIEATPSLLPGFDPDVQTLLLKSLTARGIQVHLNARVLRHHSGIEGISLEVALDKHAHRGSEKSSDSDLLSADCVLVAVGRKANTQGLGLETIGLPLDDRGCINVNCHGQTQFEHIYAIGDVTGGPMLAHRASHMGLCAAAHIIDPEAGMAFSPMAIPSAVFSDPEIASVGFSEPEAKAKFGDAQIKTGLFPWAASGRAMAMSVDLKPPVGFVKIVSHAQTDRLLGVHMAGAHVAELVSEATLAIEAGATVEDLALTIHPHPTLSEGLMEAAEALHHQAIHIYQPTRP